MERGKVAMRGYGNGLAHLGGCCLDAGGPTTGSSCLRAGSREDGGPTHSHDSSSSCSSAPLLQRTETQPLPRSVSCNNGMSSVYF